MTESELDYLAWPTGCLCEWRHAAGLDGAVPSGALVEAAAMEDADVLPRPIEATRG